MSTSSDGPRPLPTAEAARETIETESIATLRRGPFRGLRERWNELSRPAQWGWMLIVVAIAYAMPYLNFFPLSTAPGNDWPLALFAMAVYALVAVGLNVVVGYAGLLDLGYVAFFAVGSYTAAMFTSPDSPYLKIPYLWTLPLAMVIAMIFGVVLGVPTLRLRGDYLAIVTLGFGEIVRILATIIPAMKGQVGFQNVGRPPGDGPNGIPIFANSNGTPWYWLTVTILIIILLLAGNLERSRVGRAWIAIREDEDAAETMGVPTFKYKVWAFAIGASVGGLSGALFAGQVGFVNNQKFDVQTSILFLAAVVLGGTGNKVGAILGGAIVAYIPLRFTAVADYKYLIFGVALVILMIYRSQGLIPAKMRLMAYSRKAIEWVAPPKTPRGAEPPGAPTPRTEGGAS
ncbi:MULTISPECIES: branched-chain amino acid ABC transporter permease [Microbacterium]|uniref:Leucine/isoleucine/valine transporter permease subunit n=1 Tax=Microbacterium azadirachtae TaxID=582680 RepID=A0A0F0LU83_9MICO|nr:MULTISPECIES: branched-chain amino acid ABC transporter permease [Microbacterium]KJL36284.1 leucine/isoleucine/valine transporter permease subunit [Microbacterium azadirachtae]PRB05347.1 branched-chain amino acid ABC transporter permease [Microbacterium sp. MYb64]